MAHSVTVSVDYTVFVCVFCFFPPSLRHATRMGLATCWIGPGADQSSVQQKLGPRFNEEMDVDMVGDGWISMEFSLMAINCE